MEDPAEIRLKRKVKLFVVAAMSLFFVLVVVVVFQFAIRINQAAQIRALTKNNETIEKQIERAKNDAAYYLTKEFMYDYALRVYNRAPDGTRVVK